MKKELKGSIVCGYQGIGKTYITEKCPDRFIDLDSSMFFVNGVRDENWYKVYTNIALELANNGFTVLISTHKVLMDWLDSNNIPFTLVIPAAEIKEGWVDRLKKRCVADYSVKNYKAYVNALEQLDKNLVDNYIKNYNCIVLESLEYDLVEILSKK